VILTGLPAGVGLLTEQFLASGDVVEVTVGAPPPVRNDVVAAPPTSEVVRHRRVCDQKPGSISTSREFRAKATMRYWPTRIGNSICRFPL
jgi:hypothetical protein